MSAISKINVNGTNYDILGLPVGTIFASALPQTNSGVHLLDGSYIATNGIYNQFCTLVEDLSTDYDILCTAQEYENDILATGNCGKFVLDTTNNTLRLPTITTFIQGLSDLTTLGQAVEAGLPNITGSFANWGESASQTAAFVEGAFTEINANHYGWGTASGVDSDNGDIGFDASLSSPIYGNSTTVQPASVKYPYYIVLATSKKTDIEVDLDEVASDLNGKLSNQTKHIIETYVNGTSGYRIWSDGYCEQWGYTTWSSNPIPQIIFLKEFTDTNYTLFFQDAGTAQDQFNDGISIYLKSVESFKFAPYTDNRAMNWIAKGYLAQGEY